MKNNIQSGNDKEEIMTLILADMRNRKLLMGLDAAGLSTDDFNTNLSALIFSKMGVAKQLEDRISNWYEDMVFNILDIDLNIFREHQLFLAVTLYDALQEQNRKLQMELMLKLKPGKSFLQLAGFRRCDN